MSRYSLRDPKCRHKATRRVSSHVDLQAGFESDEPFASTHVCDRAECLEDAKEWLFASTRRSVCHVIPLRGAR